MSEAMRQYLEAESAFLAWRKIHPEDTPEEDAMLDRMDDLWWAMSKDERDQLRDVRKLVI